jgi:hypothetical protein
LFAVVAICCVLFAFISRQLNDAAAERRAVASIELAGGIARTAKGCIVTSSSRDTQANAISACFINNDAVERVEFLATVGCESDGGCVNGARFTQELVDSLKALPELRYVCIECANTISSDELEFVGRSLPHAKLEFVDGPCSDFEE